MKRRPHNTEALGDAVTLARAVAFQFDSVVYVQRVQDKPARYPLSFDPSASGKRRSNCYQVSPKGEVLAFPGNPPYAEPGVPPMRQRRLKRGEDTPQDKYLLERESHLRGVEGTPEVLTYSDLGIDPREILTGSRPSTGAVVLAGPSGSSLCVILRLRPEGDRARVVLVGPRESAERARWSADVWIKGIE